MIKIFRDSITDAKNLRSLHAHCVEHLRLPGDYSDLLRMDIVYCMSALDKLIHDIVTFEMVEVYAGRRAATQKYLSEPITLTHHISLSTTNPPPEIVFNGIVRLKLKHQSFLDPTKLVDALGLIWSEQDKWKSIAAAMGRNRSDVITELRNIFQRRNAIVHEADKDPASGEKYPITIHDTIQIEDFILSLGEQIYRLVR